MGENGKVSGNKSWIRLIPGVSIVYRWVVVVCYCFDRLFLYSC